MDIFNCIFNEVIEVVLIVFGTFLIAIIPPLVLFALTRVFDWLTEWRWDNERRYTYYRWQRLIGIK